MKIFAVIIKFNTLVREIPGVETIVIDNSPPNKNLGFAAAVNIGIKKALAQGADKILLLNPDIKISKKQIFLLAKNDADIISPVLKSNGVCDYGGRVNWWIGRTTHKEVRGVGEVGDVRERDFVSGACMMINKKVFDGIGFFDERFFMYFEDADFCLRAKQAGFSVGVEGSAVVDHDLETHRLSGNKKKMQFAWQSNKVFVQKWVPWYFRPLAMIYLLWLRCKISS